MQNFELQSLSVALQAFLQEESPEKKAQIIQQHLIQFMNLIQFMTNMDSLEFFKENSKLISDNIEVLPLIYKFVKEYSKKSGKILSPKTETLLNKAVEVTVDLSDTIQNGPLSDIQDFIGFVLSSSDAQEYIKSYQGQGKLSLDDAILESEKLLSHPEFQTSNVELRASTLYQGGIAYFTRYTNQGSLPDLEAAISLFEKSIAIIPSGSKNPNLYHGLGIALREKYNYSGNIMDIRRSVSLIKKAYDMLIGFSEVNELYLSNMAEIMFSSPFLKNILDSVLHYESMLNKWYQKPTHHHLYVLGRGYFRLFQDTNDRKYIDKAIDIYKKSIGITEPKNPILSKYINDLAACFHARYESYGDKNDLSEALRLYKESLEEGISRRLLISTSLRSSRGLFSLTFSQEDYSEAVKAFSYCSQAIDFLYKAQLLRSQKETWLKEMQGLASQAAYAFAKLNQPEDSVVALERGIARLLSEALQRDRANLEQLKTTGHTCLYHRYQDFVECYHEAQQQQNLEDLKEVQAELDKTIEDIRQVPGYENFLKPVEIGLIQTAAQNTPLVYILTTSAGGLALIVHPQTVTTVTLPEFTDETLTQKRISYFTAYDNQQQNRQAWHQAIDNIGQWLWQVLWQPLREKLSNQQRITLIPVGWLNLLPLHAAWTTDTTKPTGRRYALDEVTIAYAPNAVSLQKARDLATHIQSDKLLAIDEPKPVKANPLPSSSVEVHAIARHFTQPQLLRHEAATQETVKNTLNLNYNVLHFSCHGKAKANPLETGLLMANDQMLTVQHFLDAKLQARLATLSACETGMIGTKNIEEVVGLPASLLQAGVAGVVASLWSVNDLSTALLMIKFYECFFQNPSDTAVALRTAQRWLRDATQQELLDWAKSTLRGDNLRVVEEKLNWYNSDEKPYDKPYYWAAFCAVGQ